MLECISQSRQGHSLITLYYGEFILTALKFDWSLAVTFAAIWVSSGMLNYLLFRPIFGQSVGLKRGFFVVLGPIGSLFLLLVLSVMGILNLALTARGSPGEEGIGAEPPESGAPGDTASAPRDCVRKGKILRRVDYTSRQYASPESLELIDAGRRVIFAVAVNDEFGKEVMIVEQTLTIGSSLVQIGDRVMVTRQTEGLFVGPDQIYVSVDWEFKAAVEDDIVEWPWVRPDVATLWDHY